MHSRAPASAPDRGVGGGPPPACGQRVGTRKLGFNEAPGSNELYCGGIESPIRLLPEVQSPNVFVVLVRFCDDCKFSLYDMFVVLYYSV